MDFETYLKREYKKIKDNIPTIPDPIFKKVKVTKNILFSSYTIEEDIIVNEHEIEMAKINRQNAITRFNAFIKPKYLFALKKYKEYQQENSKIK
jgi:hypothetical protein